MAIISNSTPVQSGITPGTDDQNTWVTHYAKFGAGGFLVVANDTERDAISDERRKDKMVYNKDTGKFNHFNGSTWVETSVGNGSVPQSVLDDIKANSDEISRLKTIISDQPSEIYSYRGNTIPTLPNGKKAYYISLYAIPDNSILTLPDNATQGVIVVIDNADINTPMKVQISGTDVIGDAASSVAVPNDNMIFLAKGQSNNWVSAFSGYIPPSLSRLIADVKQGLPSTGTALTIAEIEAALKDKLHTFREIQKEFDNQLHTINELEKNGFLKQTMLYGYLDSTAVPVDMNWVINQALLEEPLNIAATNNGEKHLALAIPTILEHLVKKLLVDNQQVTYTSSYFTGTKTVPMKILIVDNITDSNNDHIVKFDIGIDKGAGGDTGIGVIGDDDTNINIGMADLKFPSAIVEVDPAENDKAVVKTYVDTLFPTRDEENPNATQRYKSNSIKFLPPLQGFSDPDRELGVITEIDHNAYEKQHNPGFLAYMTTGVKLMGHESLEDRFHRGSLWMDDTIIDADGIGIMKDRINKTFGLQEYDGKDPNISGGTDFFTALKLSFAGKASNGGYIRVFFAKKNATPLDDDDEIYIKDKNGNILAEEKYYQKGQELGDIQVAGIINAKGLQEFKCVVVFSLTGGDLKLNEKEDGISGLVIQALTSTEKTGLALNQFESDTGQNFNFTQLFLGDYRATLKYAFNKDMPFKTLAEGSDINTLDGWGYYAVSENNFRIIDHVLEVDSDFNLHKIFSADETIALRGKQIKVTTELVNLQTGYIVALLRHEGKPDEYPEEIFKTRTQLAPNFESGWEKVDEQIINVDVGEGFHTHEKIFTIPMEAINYAICIYPESDLDNAEIKLKDLRVDVLNPFNAYYFHSTLDLNQRHLIYDKEYRHLVQDTQGYSSLRYTINNSPIPMPVGIIKEGLADISLDPTINVIYGSSAKGGEGAIKFNREGKVTINTSLRVWSEQSKNYNVQFWYSKVSSDGQTFTKIDDSDIVSLIPKHATNTLLKIPEFTLEVNPGDRIALFAQSDVVDGAFIECTDDSKPMVDTHIKFEENTVSSDVPGTGVDLSNFTLIPTTQEYGIYQFVNKRSVDIEVDIPEDVQAAVVSVQKQDLDTREIRPINNFDYIYDTIEKKFKFNFGELISGQIIIVFMV